MLKSTSQEPDKTKPQFYRRKLPETCIPFSSNEGKELFKEALTSGHMDCYFKLAAQFRTQDEPAYCGLSTLVMILNALEIDPGMVWKGPWRWYHENMLDCCIPVKVVEQEGITFGQFICLAECNGLETLSKCVNDEVSIESFREIIVRYTKQDESLIALSYSRKVLGQTGDGHFSPVGGYHPGKDLALIMDTARFKYPPHWVPLSLLFEAMKMTDTSTGILKNKTSVKSTKVLGDRTTINFCNNFIFSII
jgi:glutathione gamma-glutamylcysteinyltransferase